MLHISVPMIINFIMHIVSIKIENDRKHTFVILS